MSGNTSTLSYQRDLKVRHEPDVLVAGGGPAGIAAALAAAMVAQTGNDTRIIEIRDLQIRLKTMGAYLPNFKQ